MALPSTPPASVTPKADYDGAWKEILERYLAGFTELAFPLIAAEIAWESGMEFLDKELEEVVRDAELGKQRVDKLVKVRPRSGDPQIILFHVEVASQQYVDLERVMYQYHHRLEDRFGKPVLSVAVLADDQPAWRPGVFERDLLGCRLRFEFPVCKLLDFRARWQELQESSNPAAIVIMAHLQALETRKDMDLRANMRRELTRMLYERGLGRKDVLELMRILDWLLTLPEDLALSYRRWVVEFEQEKAMPYVTSFETMSRQEGRQEGRKDGELSIVLRLLRKRLGEIDPTVVQEITALPLEALEDLGEALLEFGSPGDLRTWLRNASTALTSPPAI